MTLDTVLIGFALSAGAIAFLNPCGFAMLPTYISYFVERNSQFQQRQQNVISSSNSNGALRLISVRRLSYGALVGLLVTAGFIAIFGLVGVGISAAGIGIVKYFSWIAVLSGVIIIGIGIAKIFGKTVHINIPIPRGVVFGSIDSNNHCSSNGNKNSGYTNFFLFGIGYAIASLSCTLPIFLLVVFQGLSAGGIVQGSFVFLSYALGMGAVMVVVSLAVSASNQTFVIWLRKLVPKMNVITSIVLILAGSYLIYYNLVVGKLLV
jgi:cytochrome c-type biogenesis protein